MALETAPIQNSKTLPPKTFWGLIVLGLVLPWIIRIGVEIFYHPERTVSALVKFPALLFAKGHNLFLLGVLNVIPVIIFLLLTRWRYRIGQAEDPAAFFPHKIGIIAAGVVVFGVGLLINLIVWMDVFRPAGGSSTAVIAFVFMPFYTLALMPVGYLVGWGIGKAMKK